MTVGSERWNPLRWALSISWFARLRAAVLAALIGSSRNRRILAALTAVSVGISGDAVRVFFDGVWGHEFVDFRVPDSRHF